MSHLFNALSPDLVMSAVESVNVWPAAEPFALNSYENRVLMFRDDAGERWVVKFYRPERWSNEAIQEEHDFLWELLQANVPVVAPWKDAKGQTLHIFEGFRFALFPQCVGQAPELDNPAHLFALGEVLGKLHDAGATRAFKHRSRLMLAPGIAEAQEVVLNSQWLNKHQQRAYQNAIQKILSHTDEKRVGEAAYIRAHGDCHLGNVLGRGESFTLVDFDDCLMAPAIQDVWMLLPVSDPTSWRVQLSELAEGYEETRAFPYDEVPLIESLRAYRLVRYAAWLVARWEDPAFPRAFPWLAESGYWDHHIRQLEQQCLQLERPVWLA